MNKAELELAKLEINGLGQILTITALACLITPIYFALFPDRLVPILLLSGCVTLNIYLVIKINKLSKRIKMELKKDALCQSSENE